MSLRLPFPGGVPVRYALALILLGAALLLWTGFRPDALPYVPGARFSDAAVSHWPAAYFMHQSLQQGELPLWRETIMGGQPFMANPLNKTAYPPQWLAAVLPPTLHLNLMIALHFGLAGWGMWRWTRALGLGKPAAAFSAFAYAFAPRALGHTGAGHLDLLYAMAWFPWVMGEVYSYFAPHPNPLPEFREGESSSPPNSSLYERSSPGPGGESPHPNPSPSGRGAKDQIAAVVSPSPRLRANLFVQRGGWEVRGHGLRLALVAALLFLADTRLSLFALATAAAYGLYLARAQRVGVWPLLRLLPLGLVFLLLTVSLIFPLSLWSPYLSRAALTQAEAGVFSLEPGHLIGLVIPAGGSVETLTYLSLPVLALAGIGLLTRRLWGWAALVLIAALYALGVHGFLWPLLTDLVPGLLWFRVPSRAWFVVALVAPLLAGYGLDALIAAHTSAQVTKSHIRLIGLIGLVAAVACGAFALSIPTLPRAAALTTLVIGGGTGLLLAVRPRSTVLAAGFGLLLLIDMALVGRTWIEWRTDYLPGRALAERLVELRANRIYSPTYSLEQQTAELYGLRLFGGVDPFQLAGMNEAIREAGGVPDVGYSVVQPPLVGVIGDDLSTANRDSRPDPVKLAEWDVSHVVAAYPLDVDGLRLVDTVEGVYVYANEASPDEQIPSLTGIPSSETIEEINRLTVIAAFISMITFAVCIVLLLTQRRKGANSALE